MCCCLVVTSPAVYHCTICCVPGAADEVQNTPSSKECTKQASASAAALLSGFLLIMVWEVDGLCTAVFFTSPIISSWSFQHQEAHLYGPLNVLYFVSNNLEGKKWLVLDNTVTPALLHGTGLNRCSHSRRETCGKPLLSVLGFCGKRFSAVVTGTFRRKKRPGVRNQVRFLLKINQLPSNFMFRLETLWALLFKKMRWVLPAAANPWQGLSYFFVSNVCVFQLLYEKSKHHLIHMIILISE